MRFIKPTVTVAIALAAGLMLSGCPASMSGGAYSRDQARQAQAVRLGYVESVRPVLIEGTQSGVGAVSGAALGGIAGSHIGKGSGQVAGAIGGAVLGGVAGAAIEENATRQQGLEIMVRLDNGRTTAVTQAADEPFYPGDRVQVVIGYDGTARVAHYGGYEYGRGSAPPNYGQPNPGYRNPNPGYRNPNPNYNSNPNPDYNNNYR